MFDYDLEICKRFMTAELIRNYLNRVNENKRDDLLGAAYAEINELGDRQSVSTESLALDLLELSNHHDKRIKSYEKDIKIFNETMQLLSDREQSLLYHAINNEHEIFTSNELKVIVMMVGMHIEDYHFTDINKVHRKERENYLNKAKDEILKAHA